MNKNDDEEVTYTPKALKNIFVIFWKEEKNLLENVRRNIIFIDLEKITMSI